MQPHTRQQSIAREFGQPFDDVVIGFALDGYSVSATAVILGYSRGSFYTLMKKWGWLDKFDKGQQTLSPRQAQQDRRGKPGCRHAIEAANGANPGYLRFTYDGVFDTLAGHAKRRGISLNTAYSRRKRRGDDWDYVLDKRSHDWKRPRGVGSMRALIIIALIAYLVVLAAAWHGCQTDRGRTCEQLEVLLWR